MLVTGTLMKVGTRADGLVFTKETLEAALPRVQTLEGVKRAWIENDELKIEMDVRDQIDALRIFERQPVIK